jgi:ligand-binding sensor domain-containing protein/DNA-binding CsgD family transcriptional regulator
MSALLKNISGICVAVILSLSGISFLHASEISNDQDIIRFISNHVPVENQNWGISQSPVNGFIYFANSEGLLEFNGISSRRFTLPYGQTIRSVHVSQDGTIFTGAFEEFGYWRNNQDGNLVYHSLSRKIKIEKNDEIWKIHEDKGTIYFQSFTTIYCYHGDEIKTVKGPFTLLFMFRTSKEFITQVLGKGLYWFDGTEFRFIGGSELFSWKKVHSIIETGENDYWICTANDGIFRFDGGKFVYKNSEISSYLKLQTCNAGLSLNDSLFVFGTIQNGVVLCNREGRIIKKFDYTNGLNNNTVLSLYKDRDNGLWIGLDEGANYFNVFSSVATYINSSGTLGTIYSLIQNKGKLYLGTNHGLFVAKIKNVNEDYSFSDLTLITGTQGQVWTIDQYDDQILCGHNEGTFLLDGSEIRKISDITGGWAIRKYNDLLIEGTYTGIIFFRKDDNGKWTFRNSIKGFGEPTRHIEVDYLGYIWASHPQKGIYKIELNEALDSIISLKYFNSISGVPRKIEIHKVNNQVIFSTSDSIYAFNYEKGEIIPLLKLNQTLGDFRTASQIIPYQKNSYWFVSGNKIALFEISKDFNAVKKLEIVQKSSDIRQRELQIIQLSDSSVLIPARQAFIIYNLSRMGSSPSVSDLKISKLVFQGDKRKIEFSTVDSCVIKVPYNTNNLTVHFANPGQFYMEQKEFQYKISEIDDEWHNTTQDYFSYLNLGYGTYNLIIRSDITSNFDKIVFTIERPWYLEWYSYILYGLALAGVIAFSIRIFRIELRKQKQLIEYAANKNKLESELDYKSYELMLTMRYLIQKNEILTELNEQIATLQKQSSKYPVKFIREMERIINQGLDSQTEEWQNAMNVLKLSQQGFFKRLKEKYPDLTQHDLRLSSYLRMNFSTKEIAKLLNISGRAVEISRYRLRRKLGLGHDVNLTEFLIKESENNNFKIQG